MRLSRPFGLPSIGARGLLLFTLSSPLLPACGPSVDPAAKADLDRSLAEITTSEETFPPSESYLPMAFAVGQWTQHRLTDDKGHASLLTYKLVGQENGAFWLETVRQSAEGREATMMLVSMLSGRDPDGMEIRALKVKKGSAPAKEVDPAMIPQVRGQYKAALDLLAMTVESEEKDDLRVPAGHFIGCYAMKTKMAWGPWQAPSDVCSHPSVPLSGVVRAKPLGQASLLELVDFGSSGAVSEF
jgi:hypothetical protein